MKAVTEILDLLEAAGSLSAKDAAACRRRLPEEHPLDWLQRRVRADHQGNEDNDGEDDD